MSNNIDIAQLAKFSPFDAMKKDNLNRLIDQIVVLQASRGEAVIKKEDRENRSYYLLSGCVALHDGNDIVAKVVGGTDAALMPLSPDLPRQHSVVATDDIRYFSLDSEFLDVSLTLDQTGIYEVGDFSAEPSAGEGDWMTALLQTKLFQQVSPQNIQTIFMRLQRVDYKAGDVVIHQGSRGDYFYIIRSGRCLVTRETPTGKADIDLAELGVGATFGEEALISEAERSATVKMQTDGILMRLAKDDFHALLNEPLLVCLEHDEAEEAAANGATWLDVRVPSEFKISGKENAINLPLYVLRHKLDILDRRTTYIVYCDTARRSSAAAFILNQYGFQAAILSGGLNGRENPNPASRV